MTSKRLLDKTLAGVRGTGAGNIVYGGNYCTKTNEHISAKAGGVLTRKKAPATVNGFDTQIVDTCPLQELSKETCPNGNHREKHNTKKKAIYASEEEEREVGPGEVLKCNNCTHRLSLTGQRQEDHMQVDSLNSLRSMLPLHVTDVLAEEIYASSHIPVPRNRKPSGHADKEVMAATVLTTLSTSPLVLNPSPGASVDTECKALWALLAGGVSETSCRGWKESLSASYSSSTSGNWSWDASDQSVPSTPSPPLSTDVSKSFLIYSQGEDNIEEAESTHFLFEDPIPRKRKNSMKVMFKCLWKNCEKVLSTSSGIQRHIRTIHLGRNGDSENSDGEEDFYYSEIEVNMDTLTEGLSNLTPTSPTTICPPPVFPLGSDMAQSKSATVINSPLSQSAPSTLCHIRTDHAYQATAPVSIPTVSSEPLNSHSAISVSWQSPSIIFKSQPGAHVGILSSGEKRQPVTHTISKTHTTTISTPKPSTGTRKPRGEAKKCRKVYGMEKKDLWCTACRWKKACQRFTD
ncbi:zinc finger protein 704 isoform X2 [Hemibagrus wyckioides]|uniref:zinc finger protein 704 isoform X2 n=1 Tax=Hemibagrus wyckioides TaxID=337641 RepID=UPI00266DAFBA|nr:zinc finger protein 704 isoform X2 [Hemibagrus wyckioides]